MVDQSILHCTFKMYCPCLTVHNKLPKSYSDTSPTSLSHGHWENIEKQQKYVISSVTGPGQKCRENNLQNTNKNKNMRNSREGIYTHMIRNSSAESKPSLLASKVNSNNTFTGLLTLPSQSCAFMGMIKCQCHRHVWPP